MGATEIPPGTSFAWEEAQRRLDLQRETAESLDSKATTLLGFHAVAFGLLANSVTKIQGWGRPVAILVVVGLGMSLFFAIRCFWVRDYDRSPSPELVWQFALKEEMWVQHRLLTTRWEALQANEHILSEKADHLRSSIGVLGVVSVILMGAIIIRLI
jgi:hypothetical protein